MCGPSSCNARRASATMNLAFPTETAASEEQGGRQDDEQQIGVARNKQNLESWKEAAKSGAKKIAREETRSVSFETSTEVFFVTSLAEMTDDEHSSTWYSEDESNETMKDNIRILRAIRKKNKQNKRNGDDNKEGDGTNPSLHNVNEDDDEELQLCARGLEPLVCPKFMRQVKDAKDQALSAVFREQDRQRRSEEVIVFDPEELLRESSARASADAVDRALSYARADADFVRRELATFAGQSLKRASSATTEELRAHRFLRGAQKKVAAGTSLGLRDTLEEALQTIDAVALDFKVKKSEKCEQPRHNPSLPAKSA